MMIADIKNKVGPITEMKISDKEAMIHPINTDAMMKIFVGNTGNQAHRGIIEVEVNNQCVRKNKHPIPIPLDNVIKITEKLFDINGE